MMKGMTMSQRELVGRLVGSDGIPTATVIIPTFNGEKYLRDILNALSVQRVPFDFEVLIVDSGSTDETLSIIGEFPLVRLHQIPNHEFGHGKTRNLAAQLARGDYLAYLSHDAIPAHEFWLLSMLLPLMGIGADAVAVLGKQIARPGCYPMLKYEIEDVFASFGPDYAMSVCQWDADIHPESLQAAMSFYSDVNSATKRDFLLNVIPYRDVRYAEDQAFGLDLIKAGYIKAYAPSGLVVHSNDLTLGEYMYRLFDELMGLKALGMELPRLAWIRQFTNPMRGILKDARRISRDPSFSWRRKVYWTFVNPLFHFSKWRAHYLASRTDHNDSARLARYSLEQRRLRGLSLNV
jgi:rhamnosyltransferase